MTSQTDGATCRRCGSPVRPDAAIERSSDPLVVNECGRCGAIVSIGGHPW